MPIIIINLVSVEVSCKHTERKQLEVVQPVIQDPFLPGLKIICMMYYLLNYYMQ